MAIADERPDSPLGRIAPVVFHYCLSCDCMTLLDRTHCSCQTCTSSDNPPYIPEHESETDPDDDQLIASGKRKQTSPSLALMVSPVKRKKVESLNTTIKQHVHAAAVTAAHLPLPHGIDRFCLVSLGYAAEDCLQTCHIVPRALDEDGLAKLEFAWGLRYYGLYLHSRYNLITLTPGFHASFDKGLWALIPLDLNLLVKLNEFFDEYGDWRKANQDNDRMKNFYGGADSFQYALLALPHGDGMRKPIIRSIPPATSRDNLKVHYFPYDTFPIITSHIRPHFVIYNLGTKLSDHNWTKLLAHRRYLPLTLRHSELFTCIQVSMALYEQWTDNEPPETFQNGSNDPKSTKSHSGSHPGSHQGSNKSGRGSQGPGPSHAGSGGRRQTSGAVDNRGELDPKDSISLVFDAAPDEDSGDEVPDDDEHTDEESDESFYSRLKAWVKDVEPDPPSLPSPDQSPTMSMKSRFDSEDGLTTLVGVMDHDARAEKLCLLSASLEFLPAGTM